jgi:hypothetical protein
MPKTSSSNFHVSCPAGHPDEENRVANHRSFPRDFFNSSDFILVKVFDKWKKMRDGLGKQREETSII